MVWFTGLSGSGKSTLASRVHAELLMRGVAVELLDADQVRPHLSSGLGFTRAGREENVRRLGYVAGLLQRHGVLVLVAAMSPYRAGRETIRQQLAGEFLEVFVDAPVETCERRDPLGLYRRFRAGEIEHVSGLDEVYEAPGQPEVHCRTDRETIDESAGKILAAILARRPALLFRR